MKNKIVVSCNVDEIKDLKKFINAIDKRQCSSYYNYLILQSDEECRKKAEKAMNDMPTMCIRITNNTVQEDEEIGVLNNIEQTVSYCGHELFLDLDLSKPNTTKLSLKDKIYDIIKFFNVFKVINVHPNGKYEDIKNVVETSKIIYDEFESEAKKLNELDELNYMQQSKLENINSKLEDKVLILGNIDLSEISDELREIIGENKSEIEQVVELALIYKQTGYDGVLCGPKELLTIKEVCGENFIVMLDDTKFSKQNNIENITPEVAATLGANYLVVGSRITDSDYPLGEYRLMNNEFKRSIGTDIGYETREYMEKLEISMHNYSKGDIAAKKLVESQTCKISVDNPTTIDGIKSPIDIDITELYKRPDIQRIITDYMVDIIKENYKDSKAIYVSDRTNPLLALILSSRLNLPLGIVSSESTNTQIIGYNKKNIDGVLIEDLLFDGSELSNSIVNLKLNNIDVKGIISIVDNDIIKSKKVSDFKVNYNTVTTISKLLYYMGKMGMISLDSYNAINSYKENPYDESWANIKKYIK